MTIFEALKTKIDMPKEIWNGKVYGPLSFDDNFEVSAWLQEKENGKRLRFRLIPTEFKIEVTKD